MEEKEKVGFFKRLRNGLEKTRKSFVSGVDSLFNGFSEIDDDFYEELEELLVMGDIGINTTMRIIDGLKEKVKEQRIKEASACKQLLIDTIKNQMQVHEDAYEFLNRKSVLLLIGVNGVGKTTSVGKLAGQFKKKVMLAAADTFRAGAIDQLKEWAGRAGVEIIAGQEGSDPAAIVYDAVSAAKARDVDILLCDTAGRLHNKKNLMAELHKIHTIIEKEYPDALLETMIVVDGTTGQNALAQAKEFSRCERRGIDKTGWDGKRWDRHCDPVRAEYSGKIHWDRGTDWRSAAV
jgi:fused signal recognition particle receptor